MNSLAKCKEVYTIGAYDEAFKNHVTVTKLGPLPASDVPPMLPKSFLEKDGSYGDRINHTVKVLNLVREKC